MQIMYEWHQTIPPFLVYLIHYTMLCCVVDKNEMQVYSVLRGKQLWSVHVLWTVTFTEKKLTYAADECIK